MKKSHQIISEEAINWWNRLPKSTKEDYSDKYGHGFQYADNLTAFEIEQMWVKETIPYEKAKNWWDSLSDDEKVILVDKFNRGYIIIQKHEILAIWIEEGQPTSKEIYETEEYKSACRAEWEEDDNETFNDRLSDNADMEYDLQNRPLPMDKEKTQVNFEMLNHTLYNLFNLGSQSFTKEEDENLILFFDLLSNNASFAHKAHKELQKRNKNL